MIPVTKKSETCMDDVEKKMTRSKVIITLLSGAVLILLAGFCYLLYENRQLVEQHNLLEGKKGISAEIVERPSPPQNQFMLECDSYAEESQKWDHVVPVKIVWTNLTDRVINATQKKLSTAASLYNFTLISHLEITLNFSLCSNDEPLPLLVETAENTTSSSQSFILTCSKLSEGFEIKRHQHTCDPLTSSQRLRNAVEKKQAKNGHDDYILLLVLVVIMITLQIGIVFIANKCKKRRQTN